MRRFRHWTARYIYPWLSRAMADILEAWLKPDDRGIEWGSGRSTIWFAERVGSVISVEHSPEWYHRVSAELKRKGLRNVEYHLCEDELEYSSVADRLPAGSFDFCLVDGMARDSCALAAISLVKPGGIMIVDNCNWYLPTQSRAPFSRRPEQGPYTERWATYLDGVENLHNLLPFEAFTIAITKLSRAKLSIIVNTGDRRPSNMCPNCKSRLGDIGAEMKALFVVFSTMLLLAGCGAAVHDNTTEVQRAVDAGGTITFPAGTYILTKTIVVKKSNTIIQGVGGETAFVFEPTLPQFHCENDRAFTTPCDVLLTPRRQITGPIAIGDSSFTASGDVSDLHSGDWLIIEEKDRKAGDVVVIDWAQVVSASGNIVEVQGPFRTAFPNAREWDPDHSGLGFYRVPQLIEGVQFRDFTIIVPDSGQGAPGISVFAAQHTLIENVTVQDSNGQALYSYLAKDLTIKNSFGNGGQILNEFGATVDLALKGNTFSCNADPGLGLDFGTGFFQVTGNNLPSSVNIGMYFLFGVHDGTVTDNSISFVKSSGVTANSGNAVGILARGTSRVNITNNFLAGGAGAASVGLSIGPAYLDVPIPSLENTITPNSFGPLWGVDYDPTNDP